MIISAVGTKGGIGKSTLAVHLVGHLFEHGHRVALLDADDQGAAAAWASEALPRVLVARASDANAILEVIPELTKGHDFVVVDGPPGKADPSRAILLRSDRALLPCGPSVLDLGGLRNAARLLKQARGIRRRLPNALVVLNRIDLRTRLGKRVRAEAPELGVPVAAAMIRNRQVIADAAGQGTLVWRMGAVGRAATQDFRKLFAEFLPAGRGKRGAGARSR